MSVLVDIPCISSTCADARLWVLDSSADRTVHLSTQKLPLRHPDITTCFSVCSENSWVFIILTRRESAWRITVINSSTFLNPPWTQYSDFNNEMRWLYTLLLIPFSGGEFYLLFSRHNRPYIFLNNYFSCHRMTACCEYYLGFFPNFLIWQYLYAECKVSCF